MSLLDSATTFIEDTARVVATSIKEIASDVGLDFDTIPEIKLPVPNVLHDYATYDYVLTVSVLHDEDIKDPDNSYFKNRTLQPGERYGQPAQIICKTANADPDNRVKLEDYGKWDCFIDNLKVEGNIGFQDGNNTSSTSLSFTIYEPFSMGLFTMACQQAAWEADHRNWNEAPFLLTIEFRGNTESGSMVPITSTTRYIPFKFQNVSMKVDSTGSHYEVSAFVWNDTGLSDKHAKLKTDMSVKGSTVQEILQTGEKSLQAVWNKRLKQFKEDKILEVPDEILIIFPQEVASDTSGSEGDSSATVGSASSSTLYEKLGVKMGKNETHVQEPEKCNIIGKASLGFGNDKTPDPSFGKQADLYNSDNSTYVRAENTPKATESEFKFRQDTDIPNAINQVILQSNFPNDSLDPKGTSPSGYKKWWRIDIQVYNISTDANYPTTGTKPKVIVYRVIPYNAHASSGITAPNQKAPGFDELSSKIIKEYNYLYTGKNTDVINFEIKLESTFSALMAADYVKGSQDVKTSTERGSANNDDATNTVAVTGNQPEKGTNPNATSFIATFMASDYKGGGGTETASTRAARLFHDAITKGGEMIDLNMKIVGDPMFLHHSGFGNYTSKPTQYPNLNKDGTINYQMGEVNIMVNFRVPIDITQETGLYKFDGIAATSPLLQFSGLYTVRQVVSTFNKGVFEQELIGGRATMQESAAKSEDQKSFSLADFTKNGIKAITGGF